VVEDYLPRFGVGCTLVDGLDVDAWRKAVRPETKAFLLETPSNPSLQIIDIAAVADIAHEAGATLTVDNVFATPLYQKPLALGADCVVYSATKHIDGQGRCLGGVILGSTEFFENKVQQFLRMTGPSISPFNAWVLLKGLETLSLRVERQTENAGFLADALHPHPKLQGLTYPGRADHPQAELIRRQMSGGSSMIALEVKGGKEGAFRFMNALRLIKISNNLGDAKSLVTHPATTTHQRFAPELRTEMGISDGLVRLSVGLEHREDLLSDLVSALEYA
jgi:O-succinylhomoserine sulfhydrylase